MNFFTIPTPHSERNGPKTCPGDRFAALETVAVRAFSESAERGVDLVQRLRLHLDQRKSDLVLDVYLGALTLIEHVSLERAVDPRITNFGLNFVHQLAA